MEQWKQLPKGFRVAEDTDVLRASLIRSAFIRGASRIGAICIELPPIGFEETFLKGINTVGDKVFSLHDKKGRRLLLSPDSTPHIVRWYSERFPDKTGTKVFFQAPVFRYRNTAKRYWIQYGIASINEHYPKEEYLIDESLLEIGKCYLKILSDLSLPVELKIGNIGISRQLLFRIGFTEKESDDFFDKLRRTDRLEWSQLVHQSLPESDFRRAFLELLEFKFLQNMNLGELLNQSSTLQKLLRKELESLMHFANLMTEDTLIPFKLVFDDFHSSELLNGINFRLMIPGKERHYADGGCYTYYSTKVTDHIESFKSIAGGLSHALKIISTEVLKAKLDVLVLSRNGSALLCRQIADYLRNNSLNVRVMEQKGSFKSVLTQFALGNSVILVENGNQIRILNQETEETVLISKQGNSSCFLDIFMRISL